MWTSSSLARQMMRSLVKASLFYLHVKAQGNSSWSISLYKRNARSSWAHTHTYCVCVAVCILIKSFSSQTERETRQLLCVGKKSPSLTLLTAWNAISSVVLRETFRSHRFNSFSRECEEAHASGIGPHTGKYGIVFRLVINCFSEEPETICQRQISIQTLFLRTAEV